MKKNWEIKKLGEVCEKIFAGGDKPKEYSKLETDEYCIPIFSNGEKNKGLYGYTKASKVNKPAITISARGTIGYSEIRREPFVPIVRLITLIPKNNIIDIDFLFYFLKILNFSNSGSSIPQLTIPMVREYLIPFPPLSEQKQIVDILDKAFLAIDEAKLNATKNLKNVKELFQSKLQEIFENGKLKIKNGEWEEKKLGEVCEIEYGTRVVKKRDAGTIYPVYGGGGATFFMDSYNREDCLIIARFGMSKQCVRFVKGNFFLNDSGLTVKSKNLKKIYQKFLDWYFLSLNDYIYSLSRGAAQKNLNVPMFRKISISIPPLLEQKQIVQQLDELQSKTKKLEEIYQKKIDNLEELKKSILQKAFNAELT